MIYPACKAQITLLMVREVTILAKYSDFLDIFSKKSVTELLKHFVINKHSINLELSKQPSYSPIQSLVPIKLKILKTYININLANSFI